jgi:hypothetical protein
MGLYKFHKLLIKSDQKKELGGKRRGLSFDLSEITQSAY